MERTYSNQLYLLLSSGVDVTCNCNWTLWKVGCQLLSVCIHILIALSSGSSTRLRKFALEAEAHSREVSNIFLKFCAKPVSSVKGSWKLYPILFPLKTSTKNLRVKAVISAVQYAVWVISHYKIQLKKKSVCCLLFTAHCLSFAAHCTHLFIVQCSLFDRKFLQRISNLTGLWLLRRIWLETQINPKWCEQLKRTTLTR